MSQYPMFTQWLLHRLPSVAMVIVLIPAIEHRLEEHATLYNPSYPSGLEVQQVSSNPVLTLDSKKNKTIGTSSKAHHSLIEGN